MTNDEYVKHNGNICPHCESRNISAGEMNQLGLTELTIGFECYDCKAMWDEVYTITLNGFENLTVDE